MLRTLLDQQLVDYVAMDVKTSLAEYPKLGGTVKPENIQESIRLLKASGIPYEFRTTIIKEMHTEKVLQDMAALLSGATRYHLQTFRPGHTLDPRFSAYHPFSPEEMQELVKRFSATVDEVGIRG